MKVDMVVMRNTNPQRSILLAKNVQTSIINAGDGIMNIPHRHY
jgi:aspartate carbamoyltransferase catalytic subunit